MYIFTTILYKNSIKIIKKYTENRDLNFEAVTKYIEAKKWRSLLTFQGLFYLEYTGKFPFKSLECKFI